MKGIPFVIGAFAQVIEAGHDAELHFFGDGPEACSARELVDSLGLAARVSFHGGYQRQEMDDLVESIDVGLLSSIFEGFGLVMLELMSRGRPVIATDVGSSREVLEQLGGGWVVRRADTWDLARAMIHCCQHPHTVPETGRVARRVWENHFTPARLFDRLLQFWRDFGVPV